MRDRSAPRPAGTQSAQEARGAKASQSRESARRGEPSGECRTSIAGRAAGGGRRGRRQGRRRRRGCGLLVLASLLALLGLAGAAAWTYWSLTRPYQGYARSERLVEVAPGTSAARILAQLSSEGVLENPRLARAYLVYVLHDPPLQAGEYRFSGPSSLLQVLRKLVRGEVVSHLVTLVEGLSLDETAEQLASAGAGRREALLAAMRSPALLSLVSDLDPIAPDLEGYLFPETYSFRVGTSEREIVSTLVKTFRARFDRQVRPLLGAGREASHRQLVILASIVEKEAKVATDRPLIAGVYRNRLLRHMALAADPTVIYALRKLGRWDGTIHHGDLAVDSPYNTYRYAGLPPGPICSPGLASLQAAAQPAAVPYLYFVSRNDGTHVFAETLSEHNRNVELWQKQYWREKRAEQRARGGQ
ncbi:MAG TPA: endolytic transglycosylase MltG [Thermoanaerobaculia bacterium]|nr:endolytic transglycosylase MltG [Thermoanaerobaculia bacterium]